MLTDWYCCWLGWCWLLLWPDPLLLWAGIDQASDYCVNDGGQWLFNGNDCIINDHCDIVLRCYIDCWPILMTGNWWPLLVTQYLLHCCWRYCWYCYDLVLTLLVLPIVVIGHLLVIVITVIIIIVIGIDQWWLVVWYYCYYWWYCYIYGPSDRPVRFVVWWKPSIQPCDIVMILVVSDWRWSDIDDRYCCCWCYGIVIVIDYLTWRYVDDPVMTLCYWPDPVGLMTAVIIIIDDIVVNWLMIRYCWLILLFYC